MVYWVIMVFFSLSGLSNAEAVDYFPLRVGNSWTYSPSYGAHGNRVDSIIGTETINGTLTYIWNRQEAPDDNYNEKRWLAQDGNDLKMHKIWSNERLNTVAFTPALIVGKLNPSLDETYSFVLDFILNGVSAHIKITHHIDSITDTVTVAAGTFNNCLRIIELVEITSNGETIEKNYYQHWYAPEVGPVLYRKYTEEWASTTFSQELVSFSGKPFPWAMFLPAITHKIQ